MKRSLSRLKLGCFAQFLSLLNSTTVAVANISMMMMMMVFLVVLCQTPITYNELSNNNHVNNYNYSKHNAQRVLLPMFYNEWCMIEEWMTKLLGKVHIQRDKSFYKSIYQLWTIKFKIISAKPLEVFKRIYYSLYIITSFFSVGQYFSMNYINKYTRWAWITVVQNVSIVWKMSEN